MPPLPLFRNYDPGQIVMTFKGIQMMGYADGTFIKAERAEDAFSMVTGAHGDTTRVRNRNRTGMVSLVLQAASPINDLLSAIHKTDELAGLGVGPILIKDLNGSTLVRATYAWIKKMPGAEFGTDAANNEWMFDCAALEFDPLGGSLI